MDTRMLTPGEVVVTKQMALGSYWVALCYTPLEAMYTLIHIRNYNTHVRLNTLTKIQMHRHMPTPPQTVLTKKGSDESVNGSHIAVQCRYVLTQM